MINHEIRFGLSKDLTNFHTRFERFCPILRDTPKLQRNMNHLMQLAVKKKKAFGISGPAKEVITHILEEAIKV